MQTRRIEPHGPRAVHRDERRQTTPFLAARSARNGCQWLDVLWIPLRITRALRGAQIPPRAALAGIRSWWTIEHERSLVSASLPKLSTRSEPCRGARGGSARLYPRVA